MKLVLAEKPSVAMSLSKVIGATKRDEQAILKMLAVRLICAVGTPCRYAETVIEAECEGQKYRDRSKSAFIVTRSPCFTGLCNTDRMWRCWSR